MRYMSRSSGFTLRSIAALTNGDEADDCIRCCVGDSLLCVTHSIDADLTMLHVT